MVTGIVLGGNPWKSHIQIPFSTGLCFYSEGMHPLKTSVKSYASSISQFLATGVAFTLGSKHSYRQAL